MSNLKEYKGKSIKKWHSAMDKNGNKVAKMFYEDGNTEIIRGDATLPWSSDKFYRSLSGLYQSR